MSLDDRFVNPQPADKPKAQHGTAVPSLALRACGAAARCKGLGNGDLASGPTPSFQVSSLLALLGGSSAMSASVPSLAGRRLLDRRNFLGHLGSGAQRHRPVAPPGRAGVRSLCARASGPMPR